MDNRQTEKNGTFPEWWIELTDDEMTDNQPNPMTDNQSNQTKTN